MTDDGAHHVTARQPAGHQVGSVDISLRAWIFAVSALVCGPVLSFLFSMLFRMPILLSIPLVAILLLAASYKFGLWNAGAFIKVGSILWSVAVAVISPVVFVVAVCFGGVLLHSPNSCLA